MNKINFKCIINSYNEFVNAFEKLLKIITTSGAFHVEFNLIMDSITFNDVKRIIKYISSCSSLKDVTNHCINTFILTVKANKKLVQSVSLIKAFLTRLEIVYDENGIADIEYLYKRLLKEKIPCLLLITKTKFQDIMPIYNKMYKVGIPITSIGEVEYENVSLDDFINWAYDINGTKLSLFFDLATQIILNYSQTLCKYKSCLSKYFTIDINGDIYSCRTKSNLICNISNIDHFQEIFNNDAFVEIVRNAIHTRNDCKEKCEYYDICQGGCPLIPYKSVSSCDEKTVFLLYTSIEKKLKQIIQEADYKNLNPALKDIILSGASSNKLFERGFYC